MALSLKSRSMMNPVDITIQPRLAKVFRSKGHDVVGENNIRAFIFDEHFNNMPTLEEVEDKLQKFVVRNLQLFPEFVGSPFVFYHCKSVRSPMYGVEWCR